MEQNPMKNDRRRARKERLGRDEKRCLMCGVVDPPDAVPLNLRLEQHHVATRKVVRELTAWLCSECHPAFQEALKDAGLESLYPETILHEAGALSIGFADFLRLAAASLELRGQGLFDAIDRLDRSELPWREVVNPDDENPDQDDEGSNP